MKRIIDRKVYDTETATCIAEWSNDYYVSDFHHCAESLYKTQKGVWFIAGSGGALSKYARRHGNMYGSGEGLSPITSDEAREWLERRDCTEELEKYFGDVIEEA